MRTDYATRSDRVKPAPQAADEHRVLTADAQTVKQYIRALGGSTTVASLQSEMNVTKTRLKQLLGGLEERNEIAVSTGYATVRVTMAGETAPAGDA